MLRIKPIIMDQILSMEKVLKTANLPESSSDVVERSNDTTVYKLINRFYDERGDVNPEEYVVKWDDNTEVIKTTIGRSIDGNLDIDRINPRNVHHSHFSSKGLNIANIDRDNSWNGQSAGIMYDKGDLDIINTDFYSVRSFGSIPYVEAAYVASKYDSVKSVDLDDLNLRNKYLCSKEDIHRTKWIASGGTVGGVIIVNTGDSWKLLVGKRSNKTRMNPGRISVIPNGTMEYDNLAKNGFIEDLKMNFNEEMFRGQKDPDFFDEYVDTYRVSTGWNLADGKFCVGYALVVEDPEAYDKIRRDRNENFEFDEFVEIDISDPGMITNIANINSMSPSVIPIIYRSIVLLDNIKDDVELDYSIDRQI